MGEPGQGQRTRSIAPVSDSLDKRLVAYALTAGAGLLAAPQTADALIVYTNPFPDPFMNEFFGSPISINLNPLEDAIVDFQLSINSTPGPEGIRRTVDITGAGNAVIGDGTYAFALAGSVGTIGPGSGFQTLGSRRLAYVSYQSFPPSSKSGGPWVDDFPNNLLGLRFQINGSTHYGWAQVAVTTGGEGSISVSLRDFAYEACADTAIHPGAFNGGASCEQRVPAPGTLGLLALGAAGLAAWRLRRRDGE